MSCHQGRFAGWLGLLLAASVLSSGCTPSPQGNQGNASQGAPRGVTVEEHQASSPIKTAESPERQAERAPGIEPGPQPDAGETTPATGTKSGEPGAPAEMGTVEHAPQPGEADPHAADSPAASATERLTALGEAFREVVRRVKASVVQVAAEIRPGARRRRLRSQLSAEQMEELLRRFGPLLELDPELRQFFHGRRFEQQGPDYERYNVPLPVGNASGWIYDDQGHVVTNDHVVAKADHITLTFYDDSKVGAVMVGSDPQTDIAVLKTEKSGLRPATLASQPVEQGDIVLAIGSPFRYAFSLSQGIVSAKGRRMGILGPHGYENFIQTDAAINPGNSGGPLTNARGEVVGMSTAIASRSGAFAGIGFAIPAEMIRDVADELIRKGKVERGYLGVMISDEQRLLASFGADQGVLVEDVVDGGPADRAELQPGDVITAIDGQPVENVTTLRRKVARTDPGQAVRLTVFRDGQRRTVEVTLEGQPVEDLQPDRAAQQPPPEPGDSVEAEALGKLGFERLRTITPEIAQQFGLDPSWGVLVLEVRQFSAAASAGLRRGNIITHVQGQKVTEVDALRKAVEGRDLKQGVRMRVRVPGGPARFVLLSLEN